MQISTIKYTILFVAVLATGGCKKFVESGNVNINPNKPADATLNTLLPAVENSTAMGSFWVAYTTSLLSEQMAAYQSGPINDDQDRDVRVGTAFPVLYQNGLTNAGIIITKATALGSPYYLAIGKILFVYNLSLATDTWGDVPVTEAFQAPAILYPHYDAQQAIYTLMQQYLDDAITATGQANPAALKPASDDLIFGGDMNQWKQTAYFLKARLALHTTKKDAAAAAANAITALANGYTTSSKDFQLVYNDKNLNPWQVNVANRILTGNYTITPSKRFVDALNGTAYPGLVDPRIGILIDKKTAATYVGLPNGSGGTGNTTDLTVNTYLGKQGAPLLMGTYAEQKLMEAEAQFLANGGTPSSTGSTPAAYNAYIAGITANMNKLGVPIAAANAYLTNPLVAVGPAGLRLELIMREKQIVLFLNPEAWVDTRRYDYNPALFAEMAVPQNQNADLAGNFIRRAIIPQDEITRNPNAPVLLLTDKVWWDQ